MAASERWVLYTVYPVGWSSPRLFVQGHVRAQNLSLSHATAAGARQTTNGKQVAQGSMTVTERAVCAIFIRAGSHHDAHKLLVFSLG